MKIKLINQTPDETFIYPATYMNGYNQRFKVQWCKAHPWIHYSRSVGGVFFFLQIMFMKNLAIKNWETLFLSHSAC